VALGKHVIQVNTGLEADWYGIIPIGAKCMNITTNEWPQVELKVAFTCFDNLLWVGADVFFFSSGVKPIGNNSQTSWFTGLKCSLLLMVSKQASSFPELKYMSLRYII